MNGVEEENDEDKLGMSKRKKTRTMWRSRRRETTTAMTTTKTRRTTSRSVNRAAITHRSATRTMEAEQKKGPTDVTAADSRESGHTLWRRILSTVWLFGSIFTLGFLQGQRGPALLDLQLLTNTDTDKASTFFTCGAWGYLLGAAGAGFLFDKFNRGRWQLAASLFICGVMHGVTPLCTSYPTMMTSFFVEGVAFGGIDSSANSELMRLWRHRAGPYMQALHFGFALGSLLAPLVTAPFLLSGPPDANTTEIASTALPWTSLTPASFDVTFSPTPNASLTAFHNVTLNALNGTSNSLPVTEETRILYAFVIGAGLAALFAVPFFLPFCLKAEPVATMTSDVMSEPSKTEKSEEKIPKLYYVVIVVLLVIFYFVYVSMESCFSTFLLVFVVEDQSWRKTQAAALTSVFWGSFAAVRLGGICIITQFSPVKMMLVCCFSLVLSFAGFNVSASFGSTQGLWVCTVAAGLSMGILFPTGVLFAEDKFFKVTGKIMSLFLLSASAGAMVMSPVFGNLMTNVNKMWYCYLFDILVIVLASVLVSMVVLSKTLFAERRNDLPARTW